MSYEVTTGDYFSIIIISSVPEVEVKLKPASERSTNHCFCNRATE
jgi:hypothetical protein